MMETTFNPDVKMRIHAPRDKVWEAITRLDIIKRYLDVDNLKTDWRKGSAVMYAGVWDGQTTEMQGEITEFEEGQSLTIDFPEAYGKVSFTLIDQSSPQYFNLSVHENTTMVTLTQSRPGSMRERKRFRSNWVGALKRMKDILE
jgi:uncharacterized protein YndB with AHSA1/START domain